MVVHTVPHLEGITDDGFTAVLAAMPAGPVPITGDTYGLTGDPLNVAGTPITRDFNTILARPAKFLSVVANVDIDLIINMVGAAASSAVRILANEGFSIGPDEELQIDNIVYVNVNLGENFEFRLLAY